MRDHPNGAELLVTAQKTLRERLLPSLPADRKHEALMIANAMSIAARQLDAGEAPERNELRALAELRDRPPAAADDAAALRTALLEANCDLGREIRAGASAPGQPRREALYAHLLEVARQRVRESNPKYLKA
jgi:hypothetical protein